MLLPRLASSEAMVDSRSYDILNVEEVDELMKVRAPFQLSALIHPKLSIPGTHDAIARGVLQRNPATLAKILDAAHLARLNASSLSTPDTPSRAYCANRLSRSRHQSPK